MPSFSVVIAAYQAAETVGEAIESALAQTLPALEVIVVDDGSSDGTAAALEPYAPKIRSLRQDHRGVASAWNAALEVARADFFAVLGADDAYLPQRLEALASLAVARPDLDVLCTDLVYEVDGAEAGRFGETCPFELHDQRAAILSRCFCAAPAVRRATLTSVGGFRESMRTGSDWENAIRLVHSGARAGLVDEPLYRYRIRRDSLTGDRVGALRERISFLERLGRELELSEGERATLRRSVARQRASLALAEAEVAVRSRSRDARRRALGAAATASVPLPARAAAFAAAIAPSVAARVLESREALGGDKRLRRPRPSSDRIGQTEA